MLNRAIILCPRCTGAHAEAARDLWRLGRRQQALLEWKTILGQYPDQLTWVFAELVGHGAKPEELMTLTNDGNRYEVSRCFLASGMIESAKSVLATVGDHDDAEFHLVRGQIALRENDLKAARLAGERALAIVPDDPRAVLMASEVEVRANERDKAIEVLQRAVRAGHASVEVSRKLLSLLMQTDRWQAIDRALADFRTALAAAGAPMLEANLHAAHIFEARGQYRRAISEYQAALAHNPDDIGLLLALARAAEQAGSVTVAIDAYDSVLRRAPENGEARNALGRIQRDKKVLEVNRYFPTHTGQGVK
jgi:tetratricopeptide (TPR) repeat protein